MSMFRLFFSLFLFAIFGFSADADDLTFEAAQSELFAANYDTAIEMAMALDTADGYSLAAESISAQIMLGLKEKPRKAATQARKLAQDALELEPDSHYAQVQYALARGFEARNSSSFRALRKNMVGKSRKAIERVRENFPEDPRGDALMGAWHLGIVRKAGAGTAEDMFNATMKDGIRFYDLALERAPDDIIVLSNYATTLMAIDSVTYSEQGMHILNHVKSIPASNTVEAAVKERMAEFLEHKDDFEKLESLANAWVGNHNDDED